MNKLKLQGSAFFLKLNNDSATEYLLLQFEESPDGRYGRRRLSVTNLAEINSTHVHIVTMAKLELDTPIYVHTAVGTITYDSNNYLGVGDFGTMSDARESEDLGPVSINLTLSGIDSDHIAEAKDSGNLYDRVTVYQGYLQDDGTLVDDPWVVFSGWFDYASIQLDEQSAVTFTCQHDLSSLKEKFGSRYSDEDQQNAYSGDLGLEFVAAMRNLKLYWGGKVGPGGAYTTMPSDGNRNYNTDD